MQTNKSLNIYVDESGNFGDVRDSARYCMIALVFSEETSDMSSLVKEHYDGVYNVGADPESMSFHTAPLIRQEDQFSAMSRNMRGKLFYQMLSFTRKADLRYKVICVDTQYVVSGQQIENELKGQLREFVHLHHDEFSSLGKVRLYYDAGQKMVTRILEVMLEQMPCESEIIQGAIQREHLLLQVADFICTVMLIEHRIEDGLPFNGSEKSFLVPPREFRRNVLRKIIGKEIC